MTTPTDEIMGQAQVFASAWALVGSRFDSGDGMDRAKGEEACLRGMVEALTKERDIAFRKLSALSNAHVLENMYQVGLDQEREITQLTKERDAWKQAHDEQVAKLIEIANARDALMAAAKLALAALEQTILVPCYGGHPRQEAARAALHQAGVR